MPNDAFSRLTKFGNSPSSGDSSRDWGDDAQSPRFAMARTIIDYEARRDRHGRLAVYVLPEGDGGGRFEVAGINERYHPETANQLASLIEQERHEQAEALAVSFIASYTDVAADWVTNAAIEFYLRDCTFNRGPGGAAWILQLALGVTTDRRVGPRTRAAVALRLNDPLGLLRDLRHSRETYERRVLERDESNRFWRGLVNRWNNALRAAEGFLHSSFSSLSAENQASLTMSGRIEPALHLHRLANNGATSEGPTGALDAEDALSWFPDDPEDGDACCDMPRSRVEAGDAGPVEKPEVIDKYTTTHHSARTRKIDSIIIHYTTGDDYMGAVRTFEKPYWREDLQRWIRTSAHYIVGRKGELVQMVLDNRAAWHAGNKEQNHRSIGIEHAAAPGKKLTQSQSSKSIELIKWLMAEYNIPKQNIIGHKCVRNTDCPGDILEDYGATTRSGCSEVNAAILNWLEANGV